MITVGSLTNMRGVKNVLPNQSSRHFGWGESILDQWRDNLGYLERVNAKIKRQVVVFWWSSRLASQMPLWEGSHENLYQLNRVIRVRRFCSSGAWGLRCHPCRRFTLLGFEELFNIFWTSSLRIFGDSNFVSWGSYNSQPSPQPPHSQFYRSPLATQPNSPSL